MKKPNTQPEQLQKELAAAKAEKEQLEREEAEERAAEAKAAAEAKI